MSDHPHNSEPGKPCPECGKVHDFDRLDAVTLALDITLAGSGLSAVEQIAAAARVICFRLGMATNIEEARDSVVEGIDKFVRAELTRRNAPNN